MRELVCSCNFCGKRIENPLITSAIGSDYGLVRLDGSGKIEFAFDACPECLERITDMLLDEMHKFGKGDKQWATIT